MASGIVGWQYSSKGNIPGINTKIDLDVKIGNLEKIIDNQPAPEPETEPTNEND